MHQAPTLDERITARVRATDWQQWRSKVISTGGCAHPIHLSGRWNVTHNTTGATLAERSGHILIPCGTRRAALCQPCADRYAADAFHLVRAGLTGDTSKDIPATVTERPRVFATLTAPSFGAVHTARPARSGKTLRCSCGGFHHPDDPRLGTAVDPAAYDYEAAVLWNNHAGKLWHRFTIALRRKLATNAGIPVSRFGEHARLSYAKVAEYQRRGLVHFHAVIRLDGPNGPTDPAPAWASADLLTTAIHAAAASVRVETCRPCGRVLPLVWGAQLDTRTIQAASAGDFEDGDGLISEARLAGYIAKYATKSTGATDTVDRQIHSELAIANLTGISPHHRRMIETAWELGGHQVYDGLNLRRWAHMLGFRGHFLTKSRRYSTTFKEIRGTQRHYRRTEALTQLGVTEDQVTVVNHWNFLAVGHRTDAERELAAGIAERIKTNRQTHRKEQGHGQAVER
ncbi:replication initiation protein [Crossiella sp. SN42]|uniref:replication initiator n=1 Tax=Crossiella sp. SN42 TaxID=2944808 RepID=UPI00207C152B|nr:replication initiator [Crossiella sp. SN42]MCO1577657.1 replication initiation protein [Crossiella sp. SN42]